MGNIRVYIKVSFRLDSFLDSRERRKANLTVSMSKSSSSSSASFLLPTNFHPKKKIPKEKEKGKSPQRVFHRFFKLDLYLLPYLQGSRQHCHVMFLSKIDDKKYWKILLVLWNERKITMVRLTGVLPCYLHKKSHTSQTINSPMIYQ